MEPHLARRPDGTLHGRHYPERRFRMVFLERIRRTVQLHRRRLPGLYQRSGRQHHGVLSGRSALRRRAAADRRMHLAAVQTGDPPCRGVRHLAMESGRIARLPAAHPGLLPAPAVQHPIPAKRQHLCQRAASHRSLQVLRRIYEERTQLSAVLPDPTAERGRSQRTRDLREYRRQPAPHSRQPGYAVPQHRADHHREHERLVHAAFRLSGRDHAPPGLALQNGNRFRTVFRHRQPHGAGTRSRYPLAAALPRTEHHQTSPQRQHALHGGRTPGEGLRCLLLLRRQQLLRQHGNLLRRQRLPNHRPKKLQTRRDHLRQHLGRLRRRRLRQSDPLARRAGRYDRSALLRPRHDGQQPPALHLPGRPDSDSERCETAFGRRHVHRLRIGTLLRRGQPPTLVR